MVMVMDVVLVMVVVMSGERAEDDGGSDRGINEDHCGVVRAA